MKKNVFAVFFVVLLGCGGSHYLKVTDAMQVRTLLNDDPLAVKILTPEGEELRVGDVVLTEKMIEWHSVKQIAPDRFDLILNLKSINAGRWRLFAKRNAGKQAVMILGGTVRCLFVVPAPAEKENFSITIEKVTASELGADEIDQILKKKKKETP
jgi:hypothetical protein